VIRQLRRAQVPRVYRLFGANTAWTCAAKARRISGSTSINLPPFRGLCVSSRDGDGAPEQHKRRGLDKFGSACVRRRGAVAGRPSHCPPTSDNSWTCCDARGRRSSISPQYSRDLDKRGCRCERLGGCAPVWGMKIAGLVRLGGWPDSRAPSCSSYPANRRHADCPPFSDNSVYPGHGHN
jgi:hypothetical protein